MGADPGIIRHNGIKPNDLSGPWSSLFQRLPFGYTEHGGEVVCSRPQVEIRHKECGKVLNRKVAHTANHHWAQAYRHSMAPHCASAYLEARLAPRPTRYARLHSEHSAVSHVELYLAMSGTQIIQV